MTAHHVNIMEITVQPSGVSVHPATYKIRRALNIHAANASSNTKVDDASLNSKPITPASVLPAKSADRLLT